VGVRRQAASAAAAAVESSAAKRPYHISPHIPHSLFPSIIEHQSLNINHRASNINLRSRFDSTQGVGRKGGYNCGFSLRCVALRRVDHVPNEYSICTTTMHFHSIHFRDMYMM
jgi:hypothetical protein